jgi:putative hemolysin
MEQIIIILILVLFNAFFSLSEVALISARRNRLEVDAKAGNHAAKIALKLQADPDLFLSTAQIGITIVSILTGIYSSAELAGDFAAIIAGYGIPESSALVISQSVILFVATYLQCELGELFPKRIAIDMADAMARWCAAPMLFFARLMKPFVWLLSISTEALIKLLSLQKEDKRVTEDEIKSVIQEGIESGEVEQVEQDIMERTLALGNQRVSSLMTYRTDIVTLDVNMSRLAIDDVIQNTPFSTYPVVDGDIENVLGLVTLKDLVMRMNKPHFSLRDNLLQPIYLPENITVYKALEHLKKSHYHVALICDEFGAVVGMVTFRDIFEGLVGSISDPTGEQEIIERKDKVSWIVSGQCAFFDFLDYFGEPTDYDADFNTVAGLILTLLDHIPKVGENCEWHSFQFRVVEMEGNRIDKILVSRVTETPSEKQ